MKKFLAISLGTIVAATTLASCGGENAKDIIKKNAEATANVESLSADLTGGFEMSAMGQTMNMNIDAAVDYDTASNLYHIGMDMDMVAAGESNSTSMEVYADIGEDPATYVCSDGYWIKQALSEEDAASFAEMMVGSKDASVDLTKYIKNAEVSEEKYNGKDCYKVTYDVEVDIEDLLKQSGTSLDEILEQSGAGVADETTLSLVKELFTDMGTFSCMEYYDKATMLTEYTEIDMTEFVKNIIKNLGEKLEESGEAQASAAMNLISIDAVKFQMTYNSYNDVEIVIPEEALNADEY